MKHDQLQTTAFPQGKSRSVAQEKQNYSWYQDQRGFSFGSLKRGQYVTTSFYGKHSDRLHRAVSCHIPQIGRLYHLIRENSSTEAQYDLRKGLEYLEKWMATYPSGNTLSHLFFLAELLKDFE